MNYLPNICDKKNKIKNKKNTLYIEVFFLWLKHDILLNNQYPTHFPISII